MTSSATLDLVAAVALLLIGAVHYHLTEEPMAPKTYGAHADNKLKEPFTFTLLTGDDDDEPTEHHFTATRQINKLAVALTTEGGEVDVWQWLNLIARTLDNSDGDVKAQWTGEPLPPNPSDEDEGEETEPVFRSPFGELQPMSERGTWEDKKLWTSRRRFLALFREPGVEILGDLESIKQLTKDLVAVSAGRPTDES